MNSKMTFFRQGILLAIFIAFTGVLSAQKNDTTLAHVALEKASLCEETANWDSAIVYMEGAQFLFLKEKEYGRWIDVVNDWGYYMWQANRAKESGGKLQLALKKGKVLFGEESVRVGNSYQVLGARHFKEVGELDSAEAYLNNSLMAFRAVLGEDNENVGALMGHFGQLYLAKSNPVLGLKSWEKSLEIRQETIPVEHALVAKCHLNIGINQFYLGKYQESLVSIEKGLEITKKVYGSDHLEMANCLDLQGLVFNTLGRYEKSFNNHKLALDIRQKKLGDSNPLVEISYNLIGDVLSSLEEHEGSLFYHQKALNIDMTEFGNVLITKAENFSDIGIDFCNLGDYEKALSFAKKSLDIELMLLGKEHFYIANCYINIGCVYFEQGEVEKALELFHKAKTIRIKNHGSDHPEVADCLGNIGACLNRLGQPQKALAYLRNALKIRLKFFRSNHPSIAESHLNISESFTAIAKYDSARYSIDKSRQIWLQNFGQNLSSQANCLDYLGSLFCKFDEHEKALEIYQEILSLRLKRLSVNHPNIALTHGEIARVFVDLREYEKALKYFQKAILSSVQVFIYDDLYTLPFLEEINSKRNLLNFLTRKAEALSEYATQPNAPSQALPSALQTYLLASDLIDTMRVDYSRGSKDRLAKQALPIYEGGINTALKLFQNTNDSCFLHHAWRFAEKSKSTLLLESLQEGQARRFAGIPDSLLEKERETKIFLAYNQRKLVELETSKVLDSAKISQYQNRVFNYKQRKDSLMAAIKQGFPQYYQLKYDLKVVSIPQVQSWLPNDSTALLEYFYGDSSIYVFAISKETFSVHSFRNDSTFQDHLSTLVQHFQGASLIRNQMAKNPLEFQRFCVSASGLYQDLLSPALDDQEGRINNLIFVPDGPLGKIPFEIFLNKKVEISEGAPYDELPYLIKDYTCSYAWSATERFEENLHPLLKKPSFANKVDLLAIAPPYELWPEDTIKPNPELNFMDSMDALATTRTLTRRGGNPTPLKYTSLEAKTLYNIYGARILIDSTATEANFRNLAPGSRIIHIAAHGFLNSDHPEHSNIAMLPSLRDTGELDGHLHISEIYNLNLNAELVVLPVCNSGTGENQRGEGIMSPARAFRYAGCPAVIASQWEVDDESGMEVSLNLYDNLSKGMGKAEALRQAKLKQLREGGTDKAHPFYWASMVLIGEDTPVLLAEKGKVSTHIKITLGILIGLILLILTRTIFLEKRKRRAES